MAELSRCGNVTAAAKKAGLDRREAYRHREEDRAFAAEWEKALLLGVAGLEDEARRRAFEGTERPVFNRGEECGTVREFSDTLLIVLLKAHAPEKYIDRVRSEHTGADGGPIEMAAVNLYLPDNSRDVSALTAPATGVTGIDDGTGGDVDD